MQDVSSFIILKSLRSRSGCEVILVRSLFLLRNTIFLLTGNLCETYLLTLLTFTVLADNELITFFLYFFFSVYII